MSVNPDRAVDPAGIDEVSFERADAASLTGSLASLAWFALALLIFLSAGSLLSGWSYFAGAAFAGVGFAIAAVELASSWSSLAKRTLRLAPWFLLFAVLADIFLVFSYLSGEVGR